MAFLLGGKVSEDKLTLVIKDLTGTMKTAFAMLHDIVKSHMQKKNSDKILNLSEVMSSEVYLRCLLYDSSQISTRVDVTNSIQSLMESGTMKATNDFLEGEARKRYVKLERCLRRREFGSFMGHPQVSNEMMEVSE